MKNLYLLFVFLLPSLALVDEKAVFNQVCASCFLQGINGAPKLGNRADWAARIKEVKVDLIAVIYMANQAGADWKALNQTEHQKIADQLEKSKHAHH